MTAPQDPFATPGDQPSGQQPGGYGQQPGGYGQPGQHPPPPGYGQQPFGQPGHAGPQKNGMGIASLVLGILSLVSWFFFIGGLFGLIAIILGVIALGRVKRGEANNKGVAIAGIVTGAIGLLLTVLVVVGVAALFNSGDFGSLTECLSEAGNDQAAIDECSREFEDSVTN